MGWTIYDRAHSPADRDAERAEIVRIFTSYSDAATFTASCPMASKVGSTWYLAIRLAPKPGEALSERHTTGYTPDASGAVTFAAVALTSRLHGEWGYKDLCESMGPYEAAAPMRLIGLLSPLVDGREDHAADWRRRVAEGHARRRGRFKVSPGNRIEVDRALAFGGPRPFSARRFEAFSHRAPGRRRARTLFRTLDTPTEQIVAIGLNTLVAANARPIEEGEDWTPERA